MPGRTTGAGSKGTALKGARIGVLRKGVTGYSPPTDALFEKAIADLKRLGAEVVDPADPAEPLAVGAEELEVLLTELKDGLARYLASRPGIAVRTLADVIAFNEANAAKELPHFGQEFFALAQGTGPVTDTAFAGKAARIRKLAREHLDGALAKHRPRRTRRAHRRSGLARRSREWRPPPGQQLPAPRPSPAIPMSP